MTKRERYRGCLLGLAIGDALGTTLEFRAPGTFEPIDDMIGGGPFHLQPGQWTDDTSMALCLATSLIEKRGFDAVDQMRRYTRRKLAHLDPAIIKPALIRFGEDMAELLRRRPQAGPLFPYLCTVRPGDRATEFKQRCDGLQIKGVTLHSYRYAWAERALKCG